MTQRTSPSPSWRPRRRTPRISTACAAEIRDGVGLPASTEERELYGAALDAERSGDLITARKSYLQLVQTMPRSRFVPLTYLAFGELFRTEAESEPAKAPIAAQAYREVLKFPAPDNTAFAYAALQMARVEQAGEPQKALADFKRAFEGAATSPCPEAISEHARRGMAQTYVTVGRPDRAWQFFRHVAADDAAAADMLATLLDEYQALGKKSEACVAVRSAGSTARSSPRLASAIGACGGAQ